MEDQEVRETWRELNDARLKKVEELLEALVHRLDDKRVLGASENAGERGGAAKR